MWKRYVGVLQYNQEDCGSASLATILRYFKRAVSISQLRNVMKYGRDGASVRDIVIVAQKYGLYAEALSGTLSELKEEIENNNIVLPVILHVVEETGQGHFIVLWKIKNGTILYFDPKVGNKKISEEELVKRWTGVLISFKEKDGVGLDKKRSIVEYYRKYLRFLFVDKKLIIKILVFSICVSAMSILNSLFLRTIVDEHVMDVLNSGAITEQSNQLLTLIFSLLILFYTSQAFINLLRDIATTKLSNRVNNILSKKYIQKILDIPQIDIERFEIGELLARFESLQQLQSLVMSILLTSFTEILSFILSIFFLYQINSLMTTSVILLSTLYLSIFGLALPKLEYKIKKYFSLYADTLTSVTGSLHGKIDLETLNKKDWYFSKTFKKVKATKRQVYKINLFRSYLSGGASLLDSIGMAMILWQGVLLVFSNSLTLGELVSFQSLILLYMSPIR